jgi:predicted secreted hydrolase
LVKLHWTLALVGSFFATAHAVEPVTYAQPDPTYVMQFPRDEGSHPEFRIEWWYVTGWLENAAHEPIGFQITFFRNRPGIDENNPSRFALRQVLFAHAAVSDPKIGFLLHDEKSARAGFGLAETSQERLDVHIDDWSLRADASKYVAHLAAKEFALQLEMQRGQPPMLQGQNGFSRKGPDERSASHYYSVPGLKVSGTLNIRGHAQEVQGTAWFDHEWSSTYKEEGARGWDWTGLNFADGSALMAFRMRDSNGTPVWASASTRAAGSHEVRTFDPQSVHWRALRRWRSPRTGIEYPVEWEVSVGQRRFVLRPLMDDQENDASSSTGTIYWEGAVRAFDTANQPVGSGYLELTGYGKEIKLQ